MGFVSVMLVHKLLSRWQLSLAAGIAIVVEIVLLGMFGPQFGVPVLLLVMTATTVVILVVASHFSKKDETSGRALTQSEAKHARISVWLAAALTSLPLGALGCIILSSDINVGTIAVAVPLFISVGVALFTAYRINKKTQATLVAVAATSSATES